MISPNVETFIGCDSSYRAADIVLYGAPFDSTTSYRPGARFGPSAIRHESFGLETYSPYQNADLTDFDIFDSGDLELCFGSSEAALADIEARAAEILHDGKFPLLHHVKANRLCVFYGSMQCYGTGSIYGSRLELMRKFCVFCALAGHGFDHLATGKKRRHFL